jgi:hypothetical protein
MRMPLFGAHPTNDRCRPCELSLSSTIRIRSPQPSSYRLYFNRTTYLIKHDYSLSETATARLARLLSIWPVFKIIVWSQREFSLTIPIDDKYTEKIRSLSVCYSVSLFLLIRRLISGLSLMANSFNHK